MTSDLVMMSGAGCIRKARISGVIVTMVATAPQHLHVGLAQDAEAAPRHRLELAALGAAGEFVLRACRGR